LADVFKLLIAYPSWWRVLIARFQFFMINAQREAHLFQQTPHRFGADPDFQPAELSGNLPSRLAGPFQPMYRVSGRFMLE
jgi:hypothetical protein